MKQILISLLVIFFFTNCEKTGTKINQKTMTSKNTYFINYDFGGKYTIFCNGIILADSNDSGISHSYRTLNPFIVSKGKQTISMKISKSNGGQITSNDLEPIFIDVFFSENGEKPPFKKIKKLTFPPINKPVDSLFYTWEFDADVNYAVKDVLANAVDLTKENPDNLLKEILEKYQENWTIINNGEIDKYSKLINERIEREASSMYYSENEKTAYKDKIIQRIKSAKGLMQPFQDYKLTIHLNKKIVTLVDSKGKPVLYSKDKDSHIKTFGLKLYKDSQSGELKVY